MLTPVTPATVEPVTLPEAKAHLRVIHDADDALIGSLITSAREVVESNTGRALAEAGYLWASSAPLSSPARLPLWPVATVTAVTYADSEGARQTIDAADYVVDLSRSTVSLTPQAGWSELNVEFTTAPAHVPEALKSAIKLRVQAEYEADPKEAATLQDAAARLEWTPRVNLGV